MLLLLHPPTRCPVAACWQPPAPSVWGARVVRHSPLATPKRQPPPPRAGTSNAINESHSIVVQQPVGVVIVDHGSKRETSNAMLHEFVALYRATTGQPIVEPAHMELASPSIADAVENCIQQGAKHVVVAPYFLSRGRHIQQDIPALVAAAQAQHPDVPCSIAEPIGVDEALAKVIQARVTAALHAHE